MEQEEKKDKKKALIPEQFEMGDQFNQLLAILQLGVDDTHEGLEFITRNSATMDKVTMTLMLYRCHCVFRSSLCYAFGRLVPFLQLTHSTGNNCCTRQTVHAPVYVHTPDVFGTSERRKGEGYVLSL